jgi:hypothetical protein
MYKKTYTGKTNVSVNVVLSYGMTATVRFQPLPDGTSQFITTDAYLQDGLEQHYYYDKLYTLTNTEEVSTSVTEPKVQYSKKAGDSGVVQVTPQSLSEEEKAQARENIGAATEPAELENVLKYTSQRLTDEQKAQARENIGADDANNVITSEEMAAVLGS